MESFKTTSIIDESTFVEVKKPYVHTTLMTTFFISLTALILTACGSQTDSQFEDVYQVPALVETDEVSILGADSFPHPVTQRIHESLPEFTFYHRFSSRDGKYFTSITIIDEFGNLIQEIPEVSIEIGHIAGQYIQFADYSFDGYLDFRLLYDGSTGLGFPWEANLFWLWNTEASQFVPNAQLHELLHGTQHHVDYTNRRIAGGWHTRAGAHGFNYYIKYIGGEFVRTAQNEFEYFGRAGFGHYHGMSRNIHTDFLTGEVTVTLENNTHPLTDYQKDEVISNIYIRVKRINYYIDNAYRREFTRPAWSNESLRGLTFDSNIHIAEYLYSGELILRSAWLDYYPEIGGVIHFVWYYGEAGELIFADVFQYRAPSYLIYFYDDAVVRLIPGERGNQPVTEFSLSMINAITLSLYAR